MKLRNKKTGEIIDIKGALRSSDDYPNHYLISSDWEDVPEEPKEDGLDHIITLIEAYSSRDDEYYPKEIVEKLKAWRRLEDLGTEILGWEIRDMPTGGNWQTVNVKLNVKARKEPMSLLDLLFGGEE